MLDFNKDHYTIIKKAIDPKIAEFVYNYFLMKRQVVETMKEGRWISPFAEEWGTWEDSQIPNTYSHYSDIAMETLMLMAQPVLEQNTGLTLSPTYSYARIYKKGDELKRHKDRFSCEISCTVNLGGDPWPIFIEGERNVGNTKDGYPSETDNPGKSYILEPGDMLIYKGELLEHWREPFEGEDCAQVFLHYNNTATPGWDENLYDTRPHLGLPSAFRGVEIIRDE